MIGDKCKKLFTRWILSEKETPTWTIIYYEVKNIIKLERYYPKEEKDKMYNLIFDLFFEYEYYWQVMSARQIATLLWVHHTKIDNILIKAKTLIKKEMKL